MKNLDNLSNEELIDLQGVYLQEEDYESAQEIESYLERRNTY